VTVEPHHDYERRAHMLLESALAGVGIAIVSSYMAERCSCGADNSSGSLTRFPIPQFWISCVDSAQPLAPHPASRRF